jgi:catechol 2,3-dioxygenase-like lactoylglutathione lyase family enzyme
MYPIDHMNRYVSNVDSFITFYCDALGYRLLDRGIKANSKPYAILGGCGHELFISERDSYTEERNHNFRHIGYAVEDVDELLELLKVKGFAAKDSEIIVKAYSRQFYIEDPDGFEIDLIHWTDKQGLYSPH